VRTKKKKLKGKPKKDVKSSYIDHITKQTHLDVWNPPRITIKFGELHFLKWIKMKRVLENYMTISHFRKIPTQTRKFH
jgi:hypothetical protein